MKSSTSRRRSGNGSASVDPYDQKRNPARHNVSTFCHCSESDFFGAKLHAQRNEKDAALNQLSQAVRVKDPGVIALPTDPFIDPLRDDARFKQLATALNFPA